MNETQTVESPVVTSNGEDVAKSPSFGVADSFPERHRDSMFDACNIGEIYTATEGKDYTKASSFSQNVRNYARTRKLKAKITKKADKVYWKFSK